MSTDASYYILDTRSCVGNCALWWRPNGQGYTCNLDEAGLYTYAEASKKRETDVPIHRSVVESRVVRHVRFDELRGEGLAKLREPHTGPNGDRVAWWLSHREDSESYEGPFESREAAVAYVRREEPREVDYADWRVFQGRQEQISLGGEVDWIGVVGYLEGEANEATPHGGDEPPFDLTPEQQRSLGRALEAAVAAWEAAEGLTWYAWGVEVIGEMVPVTGEGGPTDGE